MEPAPRKKRMGIRGNADQGKLRRFSYSNNLPEKCDLPMRMPPKSAGTEANVHATLPCPAEKIVGQDQPDPHSRRGAHRGHHCRCDPRGVGTAPAQGATPTGPIKTSSAEFQSTPPRRGRHVRTDPHIHHRRVSIHAPAQGATRQEVGDLAQQVVSIHAPAQGATQYTVKLAELFEFQSTPPRRGRPYRNRNIYYCNMVSIHAPAQGATFTRV